MAFVYSNWYIVLAILIACFIAAVVVYILMDRKDKEIIDEFVKSVEQENKKAVEEVKAVEDKVEEKKE